MSGKLLQSSFVIGFFGGGPQALECLSRIVADDHYNVAFVHLRDANDVSMRSFCVSNQIEILEERDANAGAAIAAVASYHVHLLISVNAKQIFRKPLLDVPTHGAVNVHNGMLPRQRGGGGAYTGIVNGEMLGTTVHFIDDGIDTGDIIAQRDVPLGPEETMGDFQGRVIGVSAELLLEALDGIRSGCVTRTSQRDLQFHYTPRKAPWDELIDWSQTSRVILDKVRARDPGPTNFYLCNDELFEVVKVALEPMLLHFSNTVGQVLQRHPDKGVLVKTGDSGIWLNRVRRRGDDTVIVPDHPPGKMLRYMLDREIFDLKQRLAVLEAGQSSDR